jgi:hypothetical protein
LVILGPNVNSFEIYLILKIVLASLRDVSPFVALLKAVTALSTVRPNTGFQSNGSLERDSTEQSLYGQPHLLKGRDSNRSRI